MEFILKDTNTTVQTSKSHISLTQDGLMLILGIESLIKQYPKVLAAVGDFDVEYNDINYGNYIYPLQDSIVIVHGCSNNEDDEPLHIDITPKDFEYLIYKILNR